MVAKRARWPAPDLERLRADLKSPDEDARGDAVRALCPCHAGWKAFEGHVCDVLRALKDRSRVVRAHALHVLEDAARMQSAGDIGYHLEAWEERIREKKGFRFRSMEERLEARRSRKMSRRKGRHGRAGGGG